MVPSTHIDEDGNVVAACDDGDDKIYRHEGSTEQAKKSVEENYSTENTSAGGQSIGYPLSQELM